VTQAGATWLVVHMPTPRDTARLAIVRVRRGIRTGALLSVSLLAISGCDGSASLGPETAIAVVNLTADTIAVQLLDREAAYLVRPIPERPAASEGDRIVYPGGYRLVPVSDISGYRPGSDLQIFVYRIRGSRSALSAMQSVSAVKLRLRGYVVEIPASSFQPP